MNEKLTPARAFVEALGDQQFERVADVLDPDVRFRALTPGSTWGHFGTASTIAALQKWFGEEDVLEVLSSSVETIGDRVHMSYRFRAHNENGWHLVEQQAYCTLADDRITDLSIVCSGFQPLVVD